MDPRRSTLAATIAVLASMLVALAGCHSDDAQPGAGAATGCGASGDGDAGQWSEPPPPAPSDLPDDERQVELVTSEGTMRARLLPDEAPNAVGNFLFLADEGYYECVPFHRIVEGFMVQTGDPTGTGTGGPGYEIADDPVERDYGRGVLAMANTGTPNSAGSQFFIVHGDASYLPPTYAIFGELVDDESLEVLDRIAATPVEDDGRGEVSSPTRAVWLEEVRVGAGDRGHGDGA